MISTFTISLNDAAEMGLAVRRGAEQLGIDVAYCAVGFSGQIICSYLQDGVKPASVDVAAAKAITALRNQRATCEFTKPKKDGGRGWSQLDVLNAQAANPGFIAWGGGIPIIWLNDAVVGAIAVSGGTEEQDHDLATNAYHFWLAQP